MKILVTGCFGFIGSHFVRRFLSRDPANVVLGVDAMTYAANRANLVDVALDPGLASRFLAHTGDIRRAHSLAWDLIGVQAEGFDAIVNFAAETHVDRSIASDDAFLETNFVGVGRLLSFQRQYGIRRFVQVSTDEVLGPHRTRAPFDESAPVNPMNPYAACKAGAEHLVLAEHNTRGTDVVITRGCNTYGTHQYQEKLIPRAILRLMNGVPVPVYGDGLQKRQWIHAFDHADGVIAALERGVAGRVYHICDDTYTANFDIVTRICDEMGVDPKDGIRFVEDRPGHDVAYRIDGSRAAEELGFVPRVGFDQGLTGTIRTYASRPAWLREDIV